LSFFSKYYEKGVDWYRSQFAECGDLPVIGEYSNSYLDDEEAPQRIEKHFPNVNLIVCLRNPIDRAYSNYWWTKRNFNKDVDLDEYLEEGFYHRHLVRWFNLFGREKIHVILFDDIKDRPEKVVHDLYGFLGVASGFVPPSLHRRVNPAAQARFEFLTYAFKLRRILEKLGLGSLIDLLKKFNLYNQIQQFYVVVNRKETTYPPLNPDERERLSRAFEKDIEKLEELLGRDLSSWKNRSPMKLGLLGKP
jgi:hypothetical protein